ncbi:hypothetical protein Y032_0045g1261 [Ancylostoma ceylanicum]|uniref:Uncharacterized protein n=1 Tax=Ancylostoma ceylanicum TaxID=53326 RepID=A0A016UD82_9BILA|nr:hypothetical protein Y032_0045g1261 [Ancylostoma ceylanicum]
MFSPEEASTSSTCPTYKPDPYLNRIKPVPPFENIPNSFGRYRTGPCSRPGPSLIPACPPTSLWKRNAIIMTLCLSISLGISLAYSGAQAYDQLDVYLSDLRDQRSFDPYL